MRSEGFGSDERLGAGSLAAELAAERAVRGAAVLTPAPGSGGEPSSSSLAAQLADREGLARAVLLAEVLGKPRALRPYGRR